MIYDLYVETQSIYHEVRRSFGRSARIDFKKLPDLVLGGLEGENHIRSMTAFVVQRRKASQSFSVALGSFGYKVELLNQGSQDVDLTLKLVDSSRGNNMIFVTCNARLLPLLKQLQIPDDRECLIFSTQDVFPQKVLRNHRDIVKSWSWEDGK